MLNFKVWPKSQWFKNLLIKNVMDMLLVFNPWPDLRSRRNFPHTRMAKTGGCFL